MWVTSLGLAGEAGIFASRPFYPMFSGVPNGPLRLSPPQVHAAVHNSGNINVKYRLEVVRDFLQSVKSSFFESRFTPRCHWHETN